MAEGTDMGVSDGYMGGSVRDLEEQNRNLKDRLILVAQNFIDFRDKAEDDMIAMKQDIQILKNSVNKIRDFIETLSGEFGKMAKKEDLDILVKQAKMFQPMDFVRRSELGKKPVGSASHLSQTSEVSKHADVKRVMKHNHTRHTSHGQPKIPKDTASVKRVENQ